jgi:hypothetical protein
MAYKRLKTTITAMEKMIERQKAAALAMAIQEFTCEQADLNGMTVEDFVFYLLDLARN